MQELLDSYAEAVEIWARRMDELNAELIHADWEADLEPSAEHERALYEARAAVMSWLDTRTRMAAKRLDLLVYMKAQADAASYLAARSPRPTAGYL